VTERDDASSAGQPAGERIVIRDKRKITPSGAGAMSAESGPERSGAAMQDDQQRTEAAAEAAAETSPAAETTPGETVTDPAEAELAEAIVADETASAEEEAEGSIADESAEAEADDGAGPLGAELELLRAQLDEAQVDIKRVAAEYKNYRERVKRDQAVVAERAQAETLAALLPVLDDLDRARDHGDLTGPFGSVAEQLTAIVTKLGLTAFGQKGDPFDPNRHEAVAHLQSADVTEPTCIDVLRRGYLLGERLLRPAMVAVAAPE